MSVVAAGEQWSFRDDIRVIQGVVPDLDALAESTSIPAGSGLIHCRTVGL
jgi:hypothetical protein